MVSHSDNPICYFAETNFREKRDMFGIYLQDRMYHTYILGRTGTGKSTLLETKIINDLYTGQGLCLIDVHGDLIQKVLKHIPSFREKDLIYLDATDPNLKLGYNVFRQVSYEKHALITSSILEIFHHLWGNQSWGVKLSHILRNTLLLLLSQPSADFSNVLKVLQDSAFRTECLKHIQNTDVKNFWEREYKSYTKNDLIPIYNKLGGILSYPSVKRILVTNKEQISLRQIMDKQKILLVNLSKGAIGTEASSILGSLLLTSVTASAFSRIDTPSENRPPFFLYLDEFQNYTNASIVEMLSELRKFQVGIVMAHQYISQLEPSIRDAVLGNVGTIICFRLGQADARFMEKEFHPVFEASDFINLANYDIYLKLMIQGVPSQAFSATTLIPEKLNNFLTLPLKTANPHTGGESVP